MTAGLRFFGLSIQNLGCTSQFQTPRKTCKKKIFIFQHRLHGFLIRSASNKKKRWVAVGMPVTRQPPHRSVHGELPHTAPASGDDAKEEKRDPTVSVDLLVKSLPAMGANKKTIAKAIA